MKKALDYLYILLFLGLLLIPVIYMNRKPYAVSDLDNRVLAYAPEIGEENFPAKFETYLKDRIGFRTEMITSYLVFNDTVAGYLDHPLYENGKDGYVFFGMHNVIQYDDFHRTYAEFVKRMQDYCESRGISFYFAFEPEKTSVLRQYVPDGVNYDDSWVDQMFSYMEEMGVHCINNTQVLTEKSKTEQVFNVKYDAGHWNDLGCFYATNNILSRIHEDYPQITELSKDEFDNTTETARYLPTSRVEVNEEVPKFTLKTSWDNASSRYLEGLNLDPDYKHFHYLISDSEDAKALPKLLMFQGSYYNGRTQYFVSRTSGYVGIHNYQNVLDLDYYINAFDPDIVLFEATEYTFRDLYFDHYAMKERTFNPPLADAREETPVSEQLEAVRASAEHMDEKNLFVLKYDGLEKVFLDNDGLRSGRYFYLLAENRIIDLKKDEYGYYSTMLDSSTDLSSAELIAVGYDGKARLYTLSVQSAHFLQNGLTESTSGIRKIEDPLMYVEKLGILNDAMEFTTEVEDNEFNSIEIQLISLDSREYYGTLYSSSSTGEKSGLILMNEPTGWYRLRLKANSSEQDEFIEYITFLQGGEYYAYSFNLNKLAKTHIVISEFRVYGPGATIPFEQSILSDPALSERTSEENGTLFFTTDVEDNAFSSVILSLMGEESEVTEIARATAPGTYKGYYCHFSPSGEYRIKLRGNSNLQDEYAYYYCELDQSALYEYSFEVVEMDTQNIVIRDLQFKQIRE